ncbi:hypothetical protein SHIRM173S_11929 [Streptomyces hirsutus]
MASIPSSSSPRLARTSSRVGTRALNEPATQENISPSAQAISDSECRSGSVEPSPVTRPVSKLAELGAGRVEMGP